MSLATEYAGYGYRRVAAVLRNDGWRVKARRVERIWRRDGLRSMRAGRTRLRLG